MLKKIITKNVGVLRAFDTPGAPQLAKLTTIYARNGRGKTTLSAILRAAGNGDDSIVKGRQTLGNGGAAPEVTLIFDNGGIVRFTAGKWTAKSVPIEVFDAAFIADNLYAGEKIDLEHDRKLFTVILGRQGVKLQRQQEVFNAAAKVTGASLKAAEAALADDTPTDMTREEFLGSAPSADIDDQIDQATKELKAVQEAGRLAKLKLLDTVTVPTLSIDVPVVLAGTVADIQATAREQLAEHFRKHKLGREGEAWVRFGREHIVDDDCPFCGREGVNEMGLITLYDQIFGDSYKTHLSGVKAAAELVEQALGPDAREQLARTVATNGDRAREWAEFCKLDGVAIPNTEPALEALSLAHDRLKPLFERKRQTPLAVIADDQVVEAAQELARATAEIEQYNDAVEAINATATAQRSGPQPSEAQGKARLENLRRRKRRGEPGVQGRVDAMLAAKRRDARARRARTAVQDRLKKANETAAAHYHERVNHYLEKFGATFRISEISNSMAGNLGSVDYGLIVRGHPISRGRKGATDAEPTFKNTLSSGDKTTLAFAFFLAGLDRDAGLTDKIVVFDDPLSSHDIHRQGRTVEFLNHLCGRCEQVIVMSHDAHFLRRVSTRCPLNQASYEIIFEGPEQWSKARVANLDDLCRSSNDVLIDHLQTYHDKKLGDATQIAPAVRKVLETHYRRSFSAYFGRRDYLGTIITKIRDGGPSHPCYADLPDLESCNAATTHEHHGDDSEVAPTAPIDPDDLHLVVRDCLQLIGALRRPTPGAAAVAATSSTTTPVSGAP
jgi:wobble nucleotide-excising tRNase